MVGSGVGVAQVLCACDYPLSADLADGARYQDTVVMNPFKGDFDLKALLGN